MRLGIHLPTFDPLRAGATAHVVEVARDAERYGFDSVWVGDHLLCPAPVMEATACLAAAAAVTERVALGFSVLLAGLRQPAWTAKQLQTISHLAPGRALTLGVGVGGDFPQELAAAEVPQGQRGRRLDETLEVLPSLLAGEPVTFTGETFSLESVALEPPVGSPLPIYVGGRGEAAIARAARIGDGWLPIFMSPERLGRDARRLAELAGEHGRPTPKVALLLPVGVDSDAARAREHADRYTRGQYQTPFERFEQMAAVGSVQQVAERLDAYRQTGVDELILMGLTPDVSGHTGRLAKVREMLGYPPARMIDGSPA